MFLLFPIIHLKKIYYGIGNIITNVTTAMCQLLLKSC